MNENLHRHSHLQCNNSNSTSRFTSPLFLGFTGVIHGSWSCWSSWSSCSSSRRSRSRSCSNPAPQNGGQGCIGDFSEMAECEDAELLYLRSDHHVVGNTGYKYHTVSDESESEALFFPGQWSLSALTKLFQQEPSAQSLLLWSMATSWLVRSRASKMLRAANKLKLRLHEALCFLQDPQDIYLEGSRVEYSCTLGFHLVGSSMIECQAGQTWSGGPGLCTRRIFNYLFIYFYHN